MMEVEGREARALASCLHNRAGRGTIARCRHGHLVCEREGAIPTAVSKGDRGLRRQRMLEEDHNSHHRWVLSSKSRPPSHVTRVFWTGGTARRSKVPLKEAVIGEVVMAVRGRALVRVVPEESGTWRRRRRRRRRANATATACIAGGSRNTRCLWAHPGTNSVRLVEAPSRQRHGRPSHRPSGLLDHPNLINAQKSQIMPCHGRTGKTHMLKGCRGPR